MGSAGAKALFGPETLLPWLTEAAEAAGMRAPVGIDALPAADDRPLPTIAPDDACYVQFSSGSTRTPTGVLVTHKALMANALAITRDGLKVRPQDRAVSWLPLYHDMGLIGFLLSPLASQMTVDLLPTAAFVRRPLIWLDLITKNGGTISYSPTFGYELCARRADTADISPTISPAGASPAAAATWSVRARCAPSPSGSPRWDSGPAPSWRATAWPRRRSR
ncbi:AMP-binding protein [Phenylobacterium sp. J367]|uniref:AMP-binding protein n=1 Tax=Phenylobacterium sp. J367 TaxID=2898435 RepID=UPI0035B0C1B9